MSDVIRYIDSAGWHWQVCEVADRRRDDTHPDDEHADAAKATPAPPADMPQSEGPPGQLYFFSRLGTRRTRRYPSTWPLLPRAELEALCHGAQVLAASRGLG